MLFGLGYDFLLLSSLICLLIYSNFETFITFISPSKVVLSFNNAPVTFDLLKFPLQHNKLLSVKWPTMYIYLFFKSKRWIFCFYVLINLSKAYFFIFILGHGNDTLKVMRFTAQYHSTLRFKSFLWISFIWVSFTSFLQISLST